jgi:hypothetical protein
MATALISPSGAALGYLVWLPDCRLTYEVAGSLQLVELVARYREGGRICLQLPDSAFRDQNFLLEQTAGQRRARHDVSESPAYPGR